MIEQDNENDDNFDSIDNNLIQSNQHGNFSKYYNFHPASSRMKLISSTTIPHLFLDLWREQNCPKTIILLDIGCNEGELSFQLLQQISSELPSTVKFHMLGIDIDSKLVELAKYRFCNEATSLIVPNGILQFEELNIMEFDKVEFVFQQYFKQHGAKGFNFISIFSITMWIHLNHGDNGLLKCLDFVGRQLSSNGSFIIEPQPWKCYRSAVKRARKSGLEITKFYYEIRLRDIDYDIIKVIKQVLGLEYVVHLGKESWGRSIFICQKKLSNSLLSSLALTDLGVEELKAR